MAAVERSSGVSAGTVLLKPLLGGGGEVEIGWHFHPDSWGKGLASKAAGALLARGFADGLEEVWTVTYLDNHPSIAVCRTIGMHLFGVTHRWYHEPSLISGPARETVSSHRSHPTSPPRRSAWLRGSRPELSAALARRAFAGAAHRSIGVGRSEVQALSIERIIRDQT